jgi:hypothetical protein
MPRQKAKPQDKITLTQNYKYAPKEFKLRLQHFLNKINGENWIPGEWRNVIITPIFKKSGRREPKTTEELASLILVTRYTLKFLI